jgi:hypothetical protein
MQSQHCKPGFSFTELDGELGHALYCGLKLSEAFYYLLFLFLDCTPSASFCWFSQYQFDHIIPYPNTSKKCPMQDHLLKSPDDIVYSSCAWVCMQHALTGKQNDL